MSDDLRARFDNYIGSLLPQEDEHLRWIQAEAIRHEMPATSIQPFEGALLGWLVRIAKAHSAVEIGTLAGYSGTWIARSLLDGGKLYTLEKSGKHAEIARHHFAHIGLDHKVDVLQGEALNLLDKLSAHGPFGFIFIDVNKELDAYKRYIEWALDNLATGGIVAAHNAFRKGSILDISDEGDHTMDMVNRTLLTDNRMDGMIIPIGDGMTVGIRRHE